MTIIRLFLAAILLFILIAVLSFVYLKWWQAILVCIAVAAMAVLGVRMAIRMFVNRIGNAVGGMFERRGEALRGASVEVHSIDPVSTPQAQQQIEDFRQ